MPTQQLLGVFIACVFVLMGGLPAPCEASTEPDTLKSQPASLWLVHEARRWHIGASLSAIGFIRAPKGAPLYEAHAHYRFHSRWTLDGSLGVSRTVFIGWPSVPKNYFIPEDGDPKEHLTLIPLKLGVTFHRSPSEGTRNRGYATIGVSLLNLHSTWEIFPWNRPSFRTKTQRRWLIGPFVGVGVGIPVSPHFLVDVGIVYRGTINESNRGFNSPGLETFTIGIGIFRSL